MSDRPFWLQQPQHTSFALGERLPNPHERAGSGREGKVWEPDDPFKHAHGEGECPGCKAEMEEALAASLASAEEDQRRRRQAEQQQIEQLVAISASEDDAQRRAAEDERAMLQRAIDASRQEHRQASNAEEQTLQRAIQQSMREQEEEWRRREDEERSIQAFLQSGGEQSEADYWKFAGHDEAHQLAVSMSKISVSGSQRRPLPPVPGGGRVLPPVPGSSKAEELIEEPPPSYAEAAPHALAEPTASSSRTDLLPPLPAKAEPSPPLPQTGTRIGSFSSIVHDSSSSALPSPTLESGPSNDSLASGSSLGQKAIPGVDYGFTPVSFSTNLDRPSTAHFPAVIQLDSSNYFVLRAHSWKSVLRAMAWYGNTTISGDGAAKLRVEVEFVTPTIPGSGPAHVAVCLSLSSLSVRSDSRRQDAMYASKGSARRLIHIPRQAPALPLLMIKLAQHLHSAHAFSAACPTSSHIARHSPRDLHHAIERHDQHHPGELAAHDDSDPEEQGTRARLKAKVKRRLGKRAAESKVVDEDLATWITPYSG